VAGQLDLELLEVVAEPYAVARVLASEQVQQSGRSSSTSAAARRTWPGPSRRHRRTRMFALGGRAFTKSIADHLDLPFPRAEEIKVDYSKGTRVEHRAEVAKIVADDVAIWAAASSWFWRSWRRRPAAEPGLHVRRRLASARDRRDIAQRAVLEATAVQPTAGSHGDGAGTGRADKGRDALCRSTGRHPARLAYQAIEMQTNEIRSMSLAPVLRAMKM